MTTRWWCITLILALKICPSCSQLTKDNPILLPYAPNPHAPEEEVVIPQELKYVEPMEDPEIFIEQQKQESLHQGESGSKDEIQKESRSKDVAQAETFFDPGDNENEEENEREHLSGGMLESGYDQQSESNDNDAAEDGADEDEQEEESEDYNTDVPPEHVKDKKHRIIKLKDPGLGGLGRVSVVEPKRRDEDASDNAEGSDGKSEESEFV